MKLHEVLIHPSTGVAGVLAVILLSGAVKFGLSIEWFIVSLSGMLAFTAGSFLSKSLERNPIYILITSEIIVFLVVFFSFSRIAGPLSLLISSAWLAVANVSPLLIRLKEMRTPVYSLFTFLMGSALVIHSRLTVPNISELRSSPSTPLEGAFGMFLIFISYPSILDWSLGLGNKVLPASFSLISVTLMLLHGFRADAILIILSTFLLLSKRNKKLSYLVLLSIFFLYMGVDVIRTELKVPVLERPFFRLSTTYYYSKELASSFLRLLPVEPFWLTSVPLHPSQTIGRGIFGKSFGITPTIFVGMLIDLGFLGMLLLSALLGLISGYSHGKFMEGRDAFSYPLIWPLLITRAEIGMTQLDLALICGSVVFSLILNFFNGLPDVTIRGKACRTTTTVP
ncbi:MAG: hypothetical protein QXO55_02365 [Candidatus Korarchaeum sp.]